MAWYLVKHRDNFNLPHLTLPLPYQHFGDHAEDEGSKVP
jgi:hypothetical protein